MQTFIEWMKIKEASRPQLLHRLIRSPKWRKETDSGEGDIYKHPTIDGATYRQRPVMKKFRQTMKQQGRGLNGIED